MYEIKDSKGRRSRVQDMREDEAEMKRLKIKRILRTGGSGERGGIREGRESVQDWEINRRGYGRTRKWEEMEGWKTTRKKKKKG